MSVGHVAREIEQAGIATVSIYVRSFRHVAEQMGVPRTVITRNPMGRPLGAPGDVERQKAAFEAALQLVESARSGGALQELEDPYRPGHL
ncbi:MAG: hypothetical protein QNJ89_12245 [Acidimicrobiia bacterium]|nr:hypothetical protein [Acidimicrobiia bacterium]